jgi:predicted O-methyltransferase YrrM
LGQKVRQLLFQAHNPYENVTVRPFNGHGWNSNSPAFQTALAQTNPLNLIVEVGSWMGGSARTMAGILKGAGRADFEIVCVDTFLGSVEHWTRESYLMTFTNGQPDVYNQFLSNVLHMNVADVITPFPCDSVNAALVLKKFGVVPDMVYIDAGHEYESVSADIKRWTELLRPGGTLLLDDAHHPPIQKAVADLLPGATKEAEKFLWKKP